MSSFSSLKTAIQNAIKANGNQEITGNLLQGILLSIVDTLGDSAINTLETDLSNEATTRGNADTEFNNLITGIKNNVDNGYVYAGIAYTSTVPVSGKVFYIATKAGTYTNLGGLSVTEGITILKYNGSLWLKEQVIYGDGGVFDVTAQNGGTTFASLEDLLGSDNLSTLIPAAVRKGGMSIKFVQTSDNKYVQYRLMEQLFSRNTSRWQGVDEKPTPNSVNLAESGGVALSINRNSNVMCYKGYLDSSGMFVEADTGSVSPFIVIPFGNQEIVIHQTRSQYGSIPSVCIYDKFGNFLESHYVDGTSSENPTATGDTTIDLTNLPNGAYYFRVRCKTTIDEPIALFDNIPTQLLVVVYPEHVYDVEKSERVISIVGTEMTEVAGGFYNSSYTFVEFVSWNSVHTDKINCSPGDIFYYKGNGYAQARSAIFFYNDAAISAKSVIVDSLDDYTEIVVPDGVNQVVFQSYTTVPNEAVLSIGKVTSHDLYKQVFKNTLSVNELETKVEELDEIVSTINIGNEKYVLLDKKDFLNSMNDWLTLGTWGQSVTYGMYPTNAGDAIAHTKQYLCDNRFAQFTVAMKANTKIRIDLKRSDALNSNILGVLGDGGSCFEIDMENKKIVMYGMGADSSSDTPSDTAWRTAFLTNTIVEQATIPDSMVPSGSERHDFIISIYRRNLTHTLVLTSLVSGEEVSCSHTGWAVGRQLAYYTLEYMSGSVPQLKKFCIYAPYSPDVVVFGDSIQEGIGCADRTKIWKNLTATAFPDLKVVLSAISGGSKVHLQRAITSEYSIYKPKNLVITIGVNDVSDENYNETTWVASMKELISQLNSMGINVIWNCASLAAQPQTEAKIEHERRIRSLNTVILSEPGEHMRFDMALAIDFDISNPANPQLLYDSGHPNAAGHAMFYRRALCDSVVLTSTRYD